MTIEKLEKCARKCRVITYHDSIGENSPVYDAYFLKGAYYIKLFMEEEVIQIDIVCEDD